MGTSGKWNHHEVKYISIMADGHNMQDAGNVERRPQESNIDGLLPVGGCRVDRPGALLEENVVCD